MKEQEKELDVIRDFVKPVKAVAVEAGKYQIVLANMLLDERKYETEEEALENFAKAFAEHPIQTVLSVIGALMYLKEYSQENKEQK